jgi:signal transduction histidine kinase
LIFDTNEEEYMVCLDKDKYEKILLNLLSNAIKFTPEGKQILVTLNMEDEYISLSVKDQGIGIPLNKLDYIFDRFAQVNTSLSRRAEGTGIGLSLVKKLTEYMSGQILVDSKEGEGSEFCIKFTKSNLNSTSAIEVASIDTTINDKINIEFSDIN